MKIVLKNIIMQNFCKAKTPVRIIHTEGNNIHFNLALEQYMFDVEKITKPTLFLWRNSPTIVIGKHQNPFKECRIEQMKEDGVILSRRKTGGGAVYHDLGNTCFSFLTPFQKDQSISYRDSNNAIIINALKKLNVEAEVSGRNDLIVDGKKFSGSAYRLSLGDKHGVGKKSLHHGTIMFSVNFQSLHKYLNPNKKKLQSKGVESVISRVTNLQTQYPHINHSNFCAQIQKQFISFYGNEGAQRETLEISQSKIPKEVKNNYERLTSWEWLYGECPYFKYTIEKKFDWGLIQITFEVQNSCISKCKIYSDCLYPDFITKFQQSLIKVKFDHQNITKMKQRLLEEFAGDSNCLAMTEDLSNWIKSQI